MKKYNNEYVHYYDMMERDKTMKNLFGFIPFNFLMGKYKMSIVMSVLLLIIYLIFPLGLIGTLIGIVLFIIINMEYNAIYDMRDEIFLNCIMEQMLYEEDLEKGKIQCWENDFIDSEDIAAIFEEAVSNYKFDHKKSIRNKIIKLFN